MGKIIEFPCRDAYDVWQYEDYCDEDEVNEINQGCEVKVKDGLVRGFIRKCLMFILVRL